MRKEGLKKVHLSVSSKITLVVVLILIITTSIGTFVEYKQEEKCSFTDFITQTEKIAIGVSKATDFLITNNKTPSLQIMVEHTSKNERCSSCHGVNKNDKKFLFYFKDMPEASLDIFVISKDFSIIASSQRDLIGKKIESLVLEKKWKHKNALKNIKKTILNTEMKSEMDNEDSSYEMFIPFKAEKNGQNISGVVFVSNSFNKLKEALFINFIGTLVAFVLLSSFIGGCLFISLKKIITEPVRRLTQFVEKFERGEKLEYLSAKVKDELGYLQYTFNEMIKTITKKEENLLKQNKIITSLYEILKTVSSSLNLKEKLNLSLEKTLEVLNLDAGGILLFDTSACNLILKTSCGFSEEFINSVKSLKTDDGLVGKAFTTGKIIALDEVRNIPHSNLEQVKKEGLKSGAYVPLKSKEDKVLGVMAVSGKCNRKFIQEEIDLLDSIGKLIGIGIENSLLFENIITAKKEWEHTFDSITDFIFINDPEFNILKVNKALAKKINMEPKELIGKKCYKLFQCKENALKSCRHSETFKTGKKSMIEIEDFCGKGIFLVSAFPLFNQENKLIGTINIIRDVTEKKAIEKEIAESNERLKESLQRLEITQEQLLQADKLSAVGQLVSGVAHELNNPLTSVIGYSQLLMKKEKEESLRSDAEKVFNEANRAAKIVGNLLTFARQKKPEKRYININDTLKKTIELRAYEMKISNIELVEKLDNNLPQTMADFQQLQQVFLNILLNAEQAMLEANNGGKLVVKSEVLNGEAVSSQHSGKMEQIIRISFKDNGAGISKNSLKKIFEPFFTTKPVGKGTGLGLSLSYGIISEHGGKIYARNNSDKGATFFVELPIIEGKATYISKEEFHETMFMKGKRILVVDDEKTIRDLLKEILVSKNCEVELAQDGDEAVNKIKRKCYDLIVSDIKMPSLDGKELYNTVKIKNPALANKIIFITGDTVNPETLSFLKKTNNLSIKKPFQTKDFLKVVEESFIKNVH